MNKKYLHLTLIILTAVLFISACGTDNDTTVNEEVELGTLIVGRGTDSQIMDPQGSNSGADALIWTQIYEGLVRLNIELEVEPVLAESWNQLDDYTWRFYLRDDVYFHNGDHFTAKDVEFTLLRALDSPAVSHIVGEIDPEGIVIVDDYTIEITTTVPFAPFLVNFTLPGMSILNERAILEVDGEINLNPVGTGPFKFNEWHPGDYISLVKNENYHGTNATLEEIIFRVVPDQTTRMISLEVGDIDLALDIAPADLNRASNLEGVNLIRRSDLGLHYLAFNNNFEPLNDVRVRQAISYAINVPDMIDTILEGVGGVATGPLNPNVWGYHASPARYEQDLERAKELLKEAGYEDGFEVNLTVNGENTMRINMASVIQNQLDLIGITVNLRTFENAAYTEYIDNGEGQMYLLTWTNVTADPENGLFPLFHTSRHGGGGNRSFFSNQEVDALLEAGRAEMDPELRKQHYLDAQRIIIDEAPWVFLTTGELLIAARDYVQGFTPSPRGLHFFNTTKIVD